MKNIWVRKKGGTRKIKDAEVPCFSPDHKPPSHMVYSPGEYEHTCSVCGKVTKFTVPNITC